MGKVRDTDPVKLFASLFAGDLTLLTQTQIALSRHYGPIDFESESLPFTHTDYYAAEFGPGLQRRIVTFRPLFSPADLPAIKLQANDLESLLARKGKRRVNIDPGYVSLGKMVLVTTKNHAHRLYLGQGIFGEVTLTYQRGRFLPWPWTFPDYGSEGYCAIFDGIRERYKAQLRAAKGGM